MDRYSVTPKIKEFALTSKLAAFGPLRKLQDAQLFKPCGEGKPLSLGLGPKGSPPSCGRRPTDSNIFVDTDRWLAKVVPPLTMTLSSLSRGSPGPLPGLSGALQRLKFLLEAVCVHSKAVRSAQPSIDLHKDVAADLLTDLPIDLPTSLSSSF